VSSTARDGDRADEGAEGEDRFAFSDFTVGVIDEVSQHSEAFVYLFGVAGSGRAASAGDISDGGHTAAGLGMITVPRAEVAVDELGVSALAARPEPATPNR
jgi:hypothetical protein